MASSNSSTVEDAGMTHVTSVRFSVGIRVPKALSDERYDIELPSGKATPMTVEEGWRLEALQDTLPVSVEQNNERGFVLTDGGEWNVILRAQTGEAYLEPRLLGLFDDRHAAVLARTDHVLLLDVSRGGQIIKLADLEENESVITFSGGAAWISSFTQGEGIESEPSGPSRLKRVTSEGVREEVGNDETQVIVGVVSDGVRHAFWNDGTFVAKTDGKTFSGTGRPLLWLASGELVVAKGVTLIIYADGNQRALPAVLAGAPVAARLQE